MQRALSLKFMPYLILFVGLCTTFLLYGFYANQQNNAKDIYLDSEINKVAVLLNDRLDAYSQVLLSGIAFFNSSNEVNRGEWKTFIESQNIHSRFPGIQGVGFAEALRGNEIKKHIKDIRSQGFNNYDVKPSGQRELYTPIVYIEPFNDRNLRAFGYDMFFEPIRKEAMQKAVYSGNITMSGKVRLVQENNIDEQAGFLMYVPLYKKNMPLASAQERQKALAGFVYAPFRAKDFMHGLFGSKNNALRIKLYDKNSSGVDNLLYDSAPDTTLKAIKSKTLTFNKNGRTWIIVFEADKKLFADMQDSTSVIIAIGGTIISFLLFIIARFLLNTRQSALKMAEQMTVKLKQTQERLDFALESSGDGIWELCLPTNAVFFDKRWKNMLGYTEDELKNIASEWESRIHPEDKEKCLNMLAAAIANNTKLPAIEYRLRCKDGSYKWVLGRGMITQKDEHNRPIKIIGLNSDITLQKTVEEKMQFLNEELQENVKLEVEKNREKDVALLNQSRFAMMGEMIGNIAHQWRQPLNSLGLIVQELKLAYKFNRLNKEYIDETVDNVMANLDYMSQTIDDFRGFFAPNKVKENFYLTNTLHQTKTLVKDSLSSAFIKLNVSGMDDNIVIFGYANEFTQAILNIINNAKDVLKALPEDDRRININITAKDNFVAMSICDNGGGIKDDIIDKVFDPYFTTKHKAQGTGIGLYMTKMIIEQHMNGTISVCNKDGGACFKITLPIVKA